MNKLVRRLGFVLFVLKLAQSENGNEPKNKMTFLPIINISDLRHSPTRNRDYYMNSTLINEAAKEAYHRLTEENKNISKMAKRDTFTANYTPIDCPALKRHHRRMRANALVSSIDDKAALLEFTTYELAKRLGLTSNQAFDLAYLDLRGTDLQEIVDEAVRHEIIFCERNSKFRTIDGTCNNLIKPRWGSSFSCFNRFIHPNYADGLSSPRRALSGNELPNPRVISTTIHIDRSVLARDFTHLVMQWGQFVDHDISLTPFSSFHEDDLILGNPNRLLDCCALRNQQNSQCFAFSIPHKDQFFSQFQQRCMNFRRSARCLRSQTAQREQINQLTSFVDGSQIYGSFLNDSIALRTLQHGLLRTQIDKQGKELLPMTPDTEKDLCSHKEKNKICFRAGDERVNEQPALTAMHTIWLRQHNALARQLRQLNPSWDDERLYQEARRIVVAQLQMITYNEFLPVVLGPLYHRLFRLNPRRLTYTRYNPNYNPTLMNAFSTAAYRFGHSLIQNRFNQVNSKGTTNEMVLENNFFFPFGLYEGELDSTLKGLMTQHAQTFDTFISQGVTNHLYKLRDEKFGLDLIAFNIQRGRDHGLRSYTDYVRFCFGLSLTRFSQLLWFMPRSTGAKFQKLYENVQDIDLFSAGISERPLPGSVVGPTFGCIIGYQFSLLKKGDRFYFEHKRQAGSFTRAQLREIRKTRLARILCDNSDGFRSVMRLPFRTVSFKGNRIVQCRDLPQLNLEPWRRTPRCGFLYVVRGPPREGSVFSAYLLWDLNIQPHVCRAWRPVKGRRGFLLVDGSNPTHHFRFELFGIRGNELTYTAPKSICPGTITAVSAPYMNYGPVFKAQLRASWQSTWSEQHKNLLQIKPCIGLWPSCFYKDWNEEVVLTRPCIGLSCLTHFLIWN